MDQLAPQEGPPSPDLERACALLACDPDQPGHLAERLADGGPEDQAQALRFARLALANDPASPFRWCDWGDLLMELRPTSDPRDPRAAADSVAKARAAFRRAEELAPSNPNVLQRIANFYFETGEPAEAMKRTYRILGMVRDFDDIIFSTYARFGVAQAEVLAHGVPLAPEPARAYLRFVFARNDPAAAAAAWAWASPPSFVTDGLARSYVQSLWRQNQFAEAAQAWATYVLKNDPRSDYGRANRIFNGGFEREFSDDNPLDWRRDSADGVEMARDLEVRQEGAASMRIVFRGTRNLDFHYFSQTPPVQPGVYRLRAMVKTQGITTDQGVRLRVVDPEAPARLDVGSPEMTGSSDWHAVELRVEVRAPTRLVRIEVARQPSLKFDSKIAGTLWIDAVSLARAE